MINANRHTYYLFKGIALFWIFICCFNQPVKSDVVDTNKIYKIEEVIVSGKRTNFSLVSPVSVQTLTEKRLEQLNALSVADAVRYFSGVQLKDYGGIGGLKTINVRSMGSAHTALFYDGIPITNAQNGQVDLGKFSLENIEEVQLFNGQRPTIFQPARGFFSSAILLLKTRTPRFSEHENYHASVGLKVGSFGTINPSMLWQQKLSDVSSLSLSAEYMKADGEYKYSYTNGTYDTTLVRKNGDIEALRAELTWHFAGDRNMKAMVKAYLYHSERGLPGAIVSNKYINYERQKDRDVFIHGMLQKAIGPGYELMVNLRYRNGYVHYSDPVAPWDNHFYQHEWYLSLVNQFTVSSWCNLSFAADVSKNGLNANLHQFSYPARYTLWGVCSADMNWKRLTVQGSLMGSLVKEQVKVGEKGDNQQVFCPALSFSVQPLRSEDFRLRAYYKKSFRMPTFNDLYYTNIGNKVLRPEFTRQYNVGATWLFNREGFFNHFAMQADVYYNRVTDKIIASPSGSLFRWTIINLGKVEIKGAELSTIAMFLPGKEIALQLGVNYTYQQAIDVTKGSFTYRDQIAYTPEHSGSATLAAGWKAWHFNYSFIYTGERYNGNENIQANYMDPWYTSDLSLAYHLMWKKRVIKINAEVNNLFNQHYDVVRNFPMPGISFRFNLNVKI